MINIVLYPWPHYVTSCHGRTHYEHPNPQVRSCFCGEVVDCVMGWRRYRAVWGATLYERMLNYYQATERLQQTAVKRRIAYGY